MSDFSHHRPVPRDSSLSIVVVGASGHLAKTKIIPALFALFCQDYLPKNFRVVGFARTTMSDGQFRQTITQNLSCRYAPGESCQERMEAFLSHCHYVTGKYDSVDDFLALYQVLREHEHGVSANRLFYMAVPPFLFYDVAKAIGDTGMVVCEPDADVWGRAVIEKPFGRDRQSSDELVRKMGMVFSEEDTYRIDHYLGKELIQNLLVLRFANRIFEPVLNNEHVERVHIAFSEDASLDERGGYFDKYGIVRDVMQNHQMQMLALLAMEAPDHFTPRHIRDEKNRLLRAVTPLQAENIVLGQYGPGEKDAMPLPAYTEHDFIDPESRTATYAAAVLDIDNDRWRGVPFLLTAGKGLPERKAEIRVHFRKSPFAPIGRHAKSDQTHNELVIRVQPDEGIFLRINNKQPGLGMEVVHGDLDLRYASRFKVEMPEAYESLILDVMRGDKSLFIRADELAAAWDIFTPVLHEIESSDEKPEIYPFGSRGPEGRLRLFERRGLPEDIA